MAIPHSWHRQMQLHLHFDFEASVRHPRVPFILSNFGISLPGDSRILSPLLLGGGGRHLREQTTTPHVLVVIFGTIKCSCTCILISSHLPAILSLDFGTFGFSSHSGA